MSLLIKSGLIVTSTDSFIGDVYVENDLITAIGSNLSSQFEKTTDEIIDAKGKYILPGVIDPHTHIDMPCMGTRTTDDFTSGTIGACCGGITSFIDFEHLAKGSTMKGALAQRKALAQKLSVIDYAFHIGITEVNELLLAEMDRTIHEYGVPSFKAYTTYDFRVSDQELIKLLKKAKESSGLIQLHSECHGMIEEFREQFDREGKNSDLYCHALSRPAITEAEAVSRAVYFTKFTDSQLYVVHLSSKEGLEVVKEAQDRGIKIIVETCPQYLTLDDSCLKKGWESSKYIISPALRKKADIDALWEGIADGYIQTIGSDHCPFNFHGIKDMNGKNDYRKIPGGAPGIETTLMLMHSEGVVKGRIKLEKMVEITSTNVANVFGIRNKGEIAVGKDADIVIFDPKQKFTINYQKLHMKVDYNPYEGMEITGMPYLVFSRGRKVAQWNKDRVEFTGRIGSGQFVYRAPFEKHDTSFCGREV